MSSKRNWLIGCGGGCLLVILAVVIGGALVWQTGKKVVAALDEVGASQEILTRNYGELRDYVPPADGRIEPGRLDVFLRVQDAIHEPSLELSGYSEPLRRLEEKKSIGPGNVITGIRSVMGLGRTVAAFMDARNAALLDQGMGLGEYSYLYAIVYYGGTWREFNPVFTIHDRDEIDRRSERLQGHFTAWLTNQREDAVNDGLDPAWVDVLDSELSRLDASKLSVPWRNGLPARTEASLSPYRDRLDAYYVDLGPLLCIGADKVGEGFDFEIQ